MQSLMYLPYVTYSQFLTSCQTYLKANSSDVLKMANLFTNPMLSENFKSLTCKFSPFKCETDPPSLPGYKISEISKVVSLPYFHGFIRSSDSQEILLRERVGSFLIRFAHQNPGYALDVRTEEGVSHWLIESVEKFQFKLHGRMFPSLDELVSYYKVNPLLKQNGTLTACLSYPCLVMQ
eukprot:TRINITY_DN227_c0_g1_i15.p1 TRINITY_DN227_c0_g1~~TRINITY_DN227_c0_g1_i15.p1  ORF type:complete len:179 (-),score=18.22 TRINITY_DN227_c0_g1_i15:81-617(-)